MMMVFLQNFSFLCQPPFTDFDVFKGSSETYVTTLKAAEATTLSPSKEGLKLRWEAYQRRHRSFLRKMGSLAKAYLFDEMKAQRLPCFLVQLRPITARNLNLKWLFGVLIRLTSEVEELSIFFSFFTSHQIYDLACVHLCSVVLIF